jgi:DNA repair ATPase RecN
MTQYKINPLLQQLQSSIQISGQIQQFSSNPEALQQAAQSLQQLFNQVSPMQQETLLIGELEERRKQLTTMRQEIETIQGAIDQIRGNVAEQYRYSLGTNKEQFETFTASIQQQTNPAAFQLFQTYHTLDQLHNLLAQISGNFMDYSAELEQWVRDQQTTQVSPTTDYEPPEKDPAPHHLSP